jgi:hypothetical protein
MAMVSSGSSAQSPLDPAHLATSSAAKAEARSWHRFSSPNGAVAFELPCSEQQSSTGGGFQQFCEDGGLLYSVEIYGTLGKPNPDYAPIYYDLMWAQFPVASSDREDIRVDGHRAVRSTTYLFEDEISNMELAEIGPNATVMLSVQEVRKGDIRAEDRDLAIENVRRFMDSLEILTT